MLFVPSLPLVPRLRLGMSSRRLCLPAGARLAPDRPVRHAMILGCVGVVLGLVGVVATWNLGLGPRWYPIALVVLAIPQCWAGAKIWEMRAAKRESR